MTTSNYFVNNAVFTAPTSIIINNVRFINNAQNLAAMINFTQWENIKAINATFPFLAFYDAEYILLSYEQNGQRHSNDSEYRKAVFSMYGDWMKSIHRLYQSDDYNINQEKINIFTCARRAAISKIQIIRNTTVSSNITVKISESELEKKNDDLLKEIEKLKRWKEEAQKMMSDKDEEIKNLSKNLETVNKEAEILHSFYHNFKENASELFQFRSQELEPSDEYLNLLDSATKVHNFYYGENN